MVSARLIGRRAEVFFAPFGFLGRCLKSIGQFGQFASTETCGAQQPGSVSAPVQLGPDVRPAYGAAQVREGEI